MFNPKRFLVLLIGVGVIISLQGILPIPVSAYTIFYSIVFLVFGFVVSRVFPQKKWPGLILEMLFACVLGLVLIKFTPLNFNLSTQSKPFFDFDLITDAFYFFTLIVLGSVIESLASKKAN